MRSTETVGFVIANPKKDILTRMYSFEGGDALFEAPVVPLGSADEGDRSHVAELNRQHRLRVSVLEVLATTSFVFQDTSYNCQWLLASLHNTDLRPNADDSEWHYLNLRDTRIGAFALGPHTEKLAWAIQNEEIRVR